LASEAHRLIKVFFNRSLQIAVQTAQELLSFSATQFAEHPYLNTFREQGGGSFNPDSLSWKNQEAEMAIVLDAYS